MPSESSILPPFFCCPPSPKVTVWNGTGEAEALSELFVDNLGSLLGTTTACVHQIGYAIVAKHEDFAPNDYGLHIAKAPAQEFEEGERMGHPLKCGRPKNKL